MPAQSAYSYAFVRVVPRVDRGEFINVGVIVFSPECRFLEARIELDAERLLALWPHVDLGTVDRHLGVIPRVCAGEMQAGPIAQLTQTERFHWLTAPRSAMIQTSPVRAGVSDDPAEVLERLASELMQAA
jgi:hypothetical protein